jgi:hypothetical protein
MNPVLSDPLDESRRIVRAAGEAGLPIRVVGGVGVALIAPSIARLRPTRTYHDIDLAAPAAGPAISTLMTSLGYLPSHRFNKLNGSERLLYHDPDGRRVDVFVDRLRMCHTLEFRRVIDRHPLTLPPADLLLSKLQIVEMTERDTQDVAALLADHELHEPDGDGIALGRIREVCCADWGWWQTVVASLSGLVERWSGETADDDASAFPGTIRTTALGRALALRDALALCRKSVGWRMRGLIGPRMRWYEMPEEVR